MTLDTAGVVRTCDAGGNIFKGASSGKGSGGRPADVHHLIWNSIRDEAKRRGLPVATVLAEKRAERPGEALTLWRPSEEGESKDAAAAEAGGPQFSSDFRSPSTAPCSYHPEYGAVPPMSKELDDFFALPEWVKDVPEEEPPKLF